jgi:hypothetical protein
LEERCLGAIVAPATVIVNDEFFVYVCAMPVLDFIRAFRVMVHSRMFMGVRIKRVISVG